MVHRCCGCGHCASGLSKSMVMRGFAGLCAHALTPDISSMRLQGTGAEMAVRGSGGDREGAGACRQEIVPSKPGPPRGFHRGRG